jgi:hypothetical protein
MQKTVMEWCGYSPTSDQLERKVPKTPLRVTPMKPLRYQTEIEPSPKLKQVEEELLMMQNEKKLAEMT